MRKLACSSKRVVSKGARLRAALLAGTFLVASHAARAEDEAPATAPEQPVASVSADEPTGFALPPVPEAPVTIHAADLPPSVEQTLADLPPPAPVEADLARQVAEDAARIAPEALRAFLEKWPESAPGLATRREREGVLAFYAARDFAPVWVFKGEWSPAAHAVLARIARADDDGLSLTTHRIPSPRGGADAIDAEVALSAAIVAYGRQASGGRVDPLAVSKLITAKPQAADPVAILQAVSSAAEPGAALLAFNPPHDGYRALRAKLAELRQERNRVSSAAPAIPDGPALKVGMRDPRVKLIRARFGLDEAPKDETGELIYDTRVASAVADFQRDKGLPASGVLTSRTIAALSGGAPERLEAEILANMERWRWLPRDLGEKRIEVNIPDYALKVVDRGAVVHRARVVVGKTNTPTPVFSDEMEYLVVNPYWNVPPSILRKEMLPKLAEDPSYWAKRGYEVVRRGKSVSVRQPPGERNALGRIKFLFPNDHAVYLHDTPSRHLFGNEKRAYSHGCVRVDQPFRLAEAVLGVENGWSEERLRNMVGGGERHVSLTKKLPVHLQYFTASVDENGKLHLAEDIYGFSRRLRLLMGLEG